MGTRQPYAETRLSQERKARVPLVAQTDNAAAGIEIVPARYPAVVRPRIEVDFNKGGNGVVYLNSIGARRSFESAGIEPTEGLVVRVWDHDTDSVGRPATLEVDAVVSFDATQGRGGQTTTVPRWSGCRCPELRLPLVAQSDNAPSSETMGLPGGRPMSARISAGADSAILARAGRYQLTASQQTSETTHSIDYIAVKLKALCCSYSRIATLRSGRGPGGVVSARRP